MKFCVDCKYYNYNYGYEICNTSNNGVNYVSGKSNPENPSVSRNNTLKCGPEGLYFEKKMFMSIRKFLRP